MDPTRSSPRRAADHPGAQVDPVPDAVRRLALGAVVVADMAAFNDLVPLDELWPYALAHSGMTGIPQAREAIGHADENAGRRWRW